MTYRTLKTVFMGTPGFAAPVLSALLDAACNVVAVYTQPDKPRGRGGRTSEPPVKQLAKERGLPVFQPTSLKTDNLYREMASMSPDVVVVAAYGRLIPPRILSLSPLGCLNVHPSILPRYRGPSPVAATILNGDDTTGVTIIKLDEGMDTGPIVACRCTPVAPEETAESLTQRLFEMGASLLLDILPRWARGEIEAYPQDESRAYITRPLSRDDGKIDWGSCADRIARQVRAYHPWPGSFTHWNGRLLKVSEAHAIEPDPVVTAFAGKVLALPDGELGIGTGEGLLVVTRLQLEGKRAVSGREFLRGYPSLIGARLGT